MVRRLLHGADTRSASTTKVSNIAEQLASFLAQQIKPECRHGGNTCSVWRCSVGASARCRCSGFLHLLNESVLRSRKDIYIKFYLFMYIHVCASEELYCTVHIVFNFRRHRNHNTMDNPVEGNYLAPADVGRQRREAVVDFVRNVVHEPLEAVRTVLATELHLLADVADRVAANHRLARVKVLLELVVQPDLHHSHVVLKRWVNARRICK